MSFIAGGIEVVLENSHRHTNGTK